MTLDEQLSVLSNHHRRRLLVALAQRTPQSDRLAPSRGLATDGGDENQTIAMQHVHLPKLADHGFIDWDQDAQRVTKGPRFDEIEPLLTVLSENQDVLPDRGVPD
jgi:predicted transcriptional regulator